jgi:hypothetical protein
VREPGRTADPSASLGMTKGRAVTFIRGRQIGWTEEKQQVPPLRFGRDDNFALKLDDFTWEINKVTASQDDDSVGSLTKNILNRFALMRTWSWVTFSRPYGTEFVNGVLTQTLKPVVLALSCMYGLKHVPFIHFLLAWLELWRKSFQGLFAVLPAVWMKGLDFFDGPGGEGCVRNVCFLYRLQLGERFRIAMPGHYAHGTLADLFVLTVERFAHLRQNPWAGLHQHPLRPIRDLSIT